MARQCSGVVNGFMIVTRRTARPSSRVSERWPRPDAFHAVAQLLVRGRRDGRSRGCWTRAGAAARSAGMLLDGVVERRASSRTGGRRARRGRARAVALAGDPELERVGAARALEAARALVVDALRAVVEQVRRRCWAKAASSRRSSRTSSAPEASGREHHLVRIPRERVGARDAAQPVAMRRSRAARTRRARRRRGARAPRSCTDGRRSPRGRRTRRRRVDPAVATTAITGRRSARRGRAASACGSMAQRRRRHRDARRSSRARAAATARDDGVVRVLAAEHDRLAAAPTPALPGVGPEAGARRGERA